MVGATIAEVALPVAVDRVTATTQVTHATAVIEAEASEINGIRKLLTSVVWPPALKAREALSGSSSRALRTTPVPMRVGILASAVKESTRAQMEAAALEAFNLSS